MKKIKLIEDAYIDGGFLRETDENGNATIYGWEMDWYQATAEDENGNRYDV